MALLFLINLKLKFQLDEKNKPLKILFKTSKSANKLIEEFMLVSKQKGGGKNETKQRAFCL